MNPHQGSWIDFQQGVYLENGKTKTKKQDEKNTDPYPGVKTPPSPKRCYFSLSEEEYFSAFEDDHVVIQKIKMDEPKKERVLGKRNPENIKLIL